MSKTYQVNEVFYSLQGEGIRVGTPNVFVRFTGCNLQCRQEAGPKSPGGFDCDTEFTSGRRVTYEELVEWINQSCWDLLCRPGEGRGTNVQSGSRSIIFTGGEPALQLDRDLCLRLKDDGYYLAIETNGSIDLCELFKCSAQDIPLSWITVSPKVAEHAIRQLHADEVKYVRGYGQEIPKTVVKASHKLISPATRGLGFDNKTVEWCTELVLRNPEWRLSPQLHKVWGVR